MKIEFKKSIVGILIVLTLIISGCRQLELYERLENIPGASWDASHPVSFELNIPDSNADYNLYATFRHTYQYPYRNVWIKLGLKSPGTDSVTYQDFNIPLATNEKWLGVGMNDVYERRVRLFNTPVRFQKAGKTGFTMQQIMRDEHLKGVLQVGLRIEKAP